MKTYNFHVTKILNNGEALIDIKEVEEIGAVDLRKLNTRLYDYPDSFNIWSGYIVAKSENDARDVIQYEL